MKKILFLSLLTLATLFLSGCVNKHGVSAKYYSECKEYYDLQGYYHRECGDDDIVTYKTMNKTIQELIKKKKPEPTSNVW
jgi:hypothetical protein